MGGDGLDSYNRRSSEITIFCHAGCAKVQAIVITRIPASVQRVSGYGKMALVNGAKLAARLFANGFTQTALTRATLAGQWAYADTLVVHRQLSSLRESRRQHVVTNLFVLCCGQDCQD